MSKKEILLIVDSISNEKNVEKDKVFEAIEKGLAQTTAKRYVEPVEIRVAIDRKSGDYDTFRQWQVIADEMEKVVTEEFEFTPSKHILLSKAKKIDAELEVGDVVEEKVESIEFGRIAAQQAKYIIMNELKQIERDEIARDYNSKLGTLVSGVAKRVSRTEIVLDMGNNVEAEIVRENLLPREMVRLGDRVTGILCAINDGRKGPLLEISRTHKNMLIELFKMEVPEISEDVIQIKAAARDPGSRAKMAVKTNDGRIDPIGACIGIRGSRVQSVSNSLGGERIDIILWDDDPAQLAVNALAPAEIVSIVVDEDNHAMDIAVKEELLAQAIGRGGQNVRLASELTGWKLNIMTEKEAASKSKTETAKVGEVFVTSLDVDEEVAAILVQEGFRTLEDLAYAPVNDLTTIEGFDVELAEELRNRARNILLQQALNSGDEVGKVEPAKDLLEMEGMTRHLAYVLASNGVVTREDLAEQAVDDLLEMSDELNRAKAGKLIMTARKIWLQEQQ